jgi:hypothetical protein
MSEYYLHFIPKVQITQSLICTCGLNKRFIKQFIDWWYKIFKLVIGHFTNKRIHGMSKR